jgi:hypothetical protein
VTTAAKLPAISETAFLGQVLELAALLGWEGVHFRAAWSTRGYRTPVQGSLGKGWPDLVLVRARDRRLIFAELKADTGKTTPEQDRVLEVLRAVTVDRYAFRDALGFRCLEIPRATVHVWRPRDFEAITELLR